jgi:ABC-type molybdenum transport system ATPase subunit/photorepair protein PhrA
MGLTAMDSIGTGFEGVFARRQLSPDQKQRVFQLLEYFKPFLVTGKHAHHQSTSTSGSSSEVTIEEVVKRQFSHFTPAQQALLLFLRAIVSRPKLVVLDEPSQGVDEAIWVRCCELLAKERKENPEQAVVMVSHYEDEVSCGLLYEWRYTGF